MLSHAIGAALTLGLASPLTAQCGAQKVLPFVFETGAQFGSALTIIDGGMAVGAWLSDAFQPDGGAVFLAEGAPGSFSLAVPLGPGDASPDQRFGRSLDGAGKWLAIGADGDTTLGTDAGAAYLFEFTTTGPKQRAKLTASNGGNADFFGRAIDLDGKRLLVGAPGQGAAVLNAGAAYVFVDGPQGWVEEARLEAQQPQAFASFGRAVALVGGTAFVGAPNADRVVVFELGSSGWAETQVIEPSTGSFSAFGTSLAASATRLVVGASNPSGSGPGRAYVYELAAGVWTETAILNSPNGSLGDQFGASVALDGDLILVGSPGADGPCPGRPNCNTGAAWLFHLVGTSWLPETSFLPCATDANSAVGTGVALRNKTALLGTGGTGPGTDPAGGAVWAYADPWPGPPNLTAIPAQYSLQSGAPQQLSFDGGTANAGRNYLFLGSTNESTGGFVLGSVKIPLGLGPYLAFTLANPISQPLSFPLGLLDGQGKTTVSFGLAPGLGPSLAGTKLWHAVVVLDLSTGFLPDFVSNAVPTELLP